MASRFTKEVKDPNNWALIADTYFITPIYGGMGRVLIRQDEYTSRFDCASCKGLGHTEEKCHECGGNQHFRGNLKSDDRCTNCYIESNLRGVPGKSLGGMQPCSVCKGTGTSSIVIPDESKTETTIGQIIAVSERDILHVKVNDKVLYTNYTGNKFEFMDNKLRTCVEKDLLCIIKKKTDKSVDGITQVGFEDLENVGIPNHD